MRLHAPGDEAGQPELPQPEQRSVSLIRGSRRGGRVYTVMLGLTARPLGAEPHIPPAAGRKKDLGVLQPGDELLGASGEWLQASLERQTICFKMGLL